MMLFKLSLKNIKKSFKDYAIYFLTLVLGVAIFYVFNALDSQEALLKLNNSQKAVIGHMNEFLGGVSILVAVILGFLIIYASRFLIKRRKKEFGIYLTLGMSKRQVSKILLMETIIIGIISLIVGLGVGVIASQFMSIVVAKMFEVDMSKFEFVFSSAAAIKTIIYYAIIYLVVMIFNVFAISKYKLINLLNASKKGEKVKVRNLTLSVILFIIAVIILSTAYYLAINRLDSLDLFGTALLMGIIGTFILFFSLSGFILKLIQSNKKIYYKNLNIFTLRQINSKVNTTVFSMSIICLLLFFTITIFSSAWSINASLKKDLKYGTPVDVVFKKPNEENSQNIYQVLEKEKLNNFSDYVEGNMYFFDTITVENLMKPIKNQLKEHKLLLSQNVPVMTISEYNKFAKFYGYKTLSLKENEYIIIADYKQMVNYQNKALEKGVTIQIGDKKYKSKYNHCIESHIDLGANKSNTGIVIMPDNIDTSKANSSIECLAANYKGDKEKVDEKIMENNYKLYNEDKITSNTKIDIYAASTGLSAIMVFMGLYLGIIFLISSAAILALKELSESSDNKEKYEMLRRIGVDDKSLDKALLYQIGIFFMFPLVIAIIHSIFGIMSASKIIESMNFEVNLSSIIMTAILLITIYGSYFLITYITSKRIINEK